MGIENKTFLTNYWERSTSASPWVYQYAIQSSVQRRRFETPATVKRPFPSGDPFWSGTKRDVASQLTNDPGFDLVDSNGRRYIENQPITTMYPRVATLGTAYDRLTGGATVPMAYPDWQIERLRNRIRSQLREDAVNLGNMLVEYRQTTKLFFEFATIVATKGRSLLKRHPRIRGMRRTVDLPKSAADAYLQFVYGIKPLAQDLGQAVGELTARVQRPLELRGKVSAKNHVEQVVWCNPSSNVYLDRARVERSCERLQRIVYRARLNPNAIRSSLASHGLLNLAALAWESVPFSFVADWWVNIGDVLGSLDNLTTVDRLTVIESTSERIVRRITPDGPRVAKGGTCFIYDRTDSRSAPTDISSVISLQYKPSLSFLHCANGVALLTSALSGKHHKLSNSEYTE